MGKQMFLTLSHLCSPTLLLTYLVVRVSIVNLLQCFKS